MVSQLSYLAAKDARIAQALSGLDHIDFIRSSGQQASSSRSDHSVASMKKNNKSSGVQENGPETDCRASTAKDSKNLKPQKLPLVQHLPDMLQTLSPLVLPLLPQLWQYFPSREHLQISGDRAARIVSVNCFNDVEEQVQDKSKESGTTLYPLISLINHSGSPNVHFLPRNYQATEEAQGIGRAPAILVAARAISPGDELQICYTEDKKALSTKWGIGKVAS